MGTRHYGRTPDFRIAILLGALIFGINHELSGASRSTEPTRDGSPEVSLKVDSDLVEIPVTVIDKADRIVDNLSARSFSLYEDGVEQTIAHFGAYEGPITACVIFDSSGSMARKLQQSIEAVKELVDAAVSGDEYCLVTFNDWPETVVRITNDPQRITNALRKIYPAGWTALLDGMSAGIGEVKQGHNSRKVIILISDGGDNRSQQTRQQIRRQVREAGAQVYSIGIVSGDDQLFSAAMIDGPALMKIISGESGGRLFLIHNIGDLPLAIRKIMLAMRYQYVLGYYPQSALRDGKYRHITVKVNPPKGTSRVHAYWRTGYYAPSD